MSGMGCQICHDSPCTCPTREEMWDVIKDMRAKPHTHRASDDKYIVELTAAELYKLCDFIHQALWDLEELEDE